MGQTIELNKLVGKRISYHDGFSGSTTEYTITSVEFDGQGYKVMGDGWAEFLFFGTKAMKQLIETGGFEQTLTIDHCPVKETYKIQG